MGGNGFHDPLVLVGILMPVVNAGDATFFVILNPVHRVATKPETSDRGAVGPPQIVGRGPL